MSRGRENGKDNDEDEKDSFHELKEAIIVLV